MPFSESDTLVSTESSFAKDDTEIGRGSIYEGIEGTEEVSKVAKTIFDTSSEFGVPIPVVERHFDKNTENFLTRGGKQFANKFALDLIEQSRPSSNVVEVFSIGNQVVDAIEKSGGLKEIPDDANIFQREGRKFLNGVRIAWEMNKAYFFPTKQRVTRTAVKELTGLRPAANFDVAEAETRSEKIVDVTAGLGAFVTQLLVLHKMLPPEMMLSDAVAFELLNRADGGLPGKGAVTAGALGFIGKIPVKTITGQLGRLTAQGGLFAGVTAAEGGSPEDIAISFLAPFALKAFGGAKGLVGDAAVGKFFKSKFPSLRIFTNAEVAKANRAAKDWLKVKDGKLSREKWSQKHGEFAVDFAKRRAAAEAEGEGALAKTVEPTTKPTVKPVTPPPEAPAAAPVAKRPAKAIIPTKAPVKPVVAKKAVEGEVTDQLREVVLTEKEVFLIMEESLDDNQFNIYRQDVAQSGEAGDAEAAGRAFDTESSVMFERGFLFDQNNKQWVRTTRQKRAEIFKEKGILDTVLEEPTAKPPPQEPRLGGKEAGATTILPDVITETTEISKRLGSTSTKVAGAAKKLQSRNVQRYTTHLKTLGDVGKDIANDFDQITQRAQVQINNSSLDTKDILKGVNKANRELIAKTINGKVDKPPKWIKERADKLRVVLDKLLNESQGLGIQRLVRGVKVDIKGTGKAFPQIPNADGERFLKLADAQGTGSSLVLDAAEWAVINGKAKSVEEYVSQLKEFRRAQLRGISGYLERTRVELPEEFVEWDPDRVLKNLFQKNWLFVEGVRQWGTDAKGQTFPKLDVKTENMRDKHGADEAQVLERFIKAAFGRELLSSKEARAISGAIRGYQFLTKIAASALTILRNMTDRFSKVSAWAPLSVQLKTIAQYPPFINTFLKHSRELEEEMIRRGAVFSNTAIAEGYQPGHLLTDLAGKAFSSSELGNQVYIALAKRNAIDANLKLLRSNPAIEKIFNKRINKVLSALVGRSKTQAALRLQELGDDALIKKLQTSEDISPDLLNEVLHRTVRDNAFPVVLSTKRAWWDNHPFIRVATQFKVWGTEQVGHIWNDVIKKTVQHRDPSLMIRWLITLAAMGEVYNILRDFVLGKDESLLKTLSNKDRRNAKDISITILKDMADGGAVGILADLMYGIPNLIGGPSAQTLANMGDATAKTIWNPKQAKDAIVQFAKKDTPAVKQALGILDKIDAQYNQKNITQDYYKVRRQTFEWKFEKEHPKGTDKAKERAIKALLGWTKSVPQERTLGYQMTIRAILTGDTEAASEQLFFLLKTADTPTKQASIEQGIQSALRNASPLGHVAERDIGEFFEGMSLGQQQKAMDIQLRWNENLAEAMALAIDKWQQWSARQ